MSSVNIKTVHSETIEELEEEITKFLLRDGIVVENVEYWVMNKSIEPQSKKHIYDAISEYLSTIEYVAVIKYRKKEKNESSNRVISSGNNLIIKQDDEVLFFINSENEELSLRTEFLTFDGYEAGVKIKLSYEDKKSLYGLLKKEFEPDNEANTELED